MYLHSVTTKENLLNQRVSSVDAVASERSGSTDARGMVNILQELIKFNSGDVSKVVDANGEPLVVYHGTKADFSVFDQSKNERLECFWFTPETDSANPYAGDGVRSSRWGQQVAIVAKVKSCSQRNGMHTHRYGIHGGIQGSGRYQATGYQFGYQSGYHGNGGVAGCQDCG